MQAVLVRTKKSGAFAYSSWTLAKRSNAQILLSFNYFKIYLYRKKKETDALALEVQHSYHEHQEISVIFAMQLNIPIPPIPHSPNA